jgi:hypothetical protein
VILHGTRTLAAAAEQICTALGGDITQLLSFGAGLGAPSFQGRPWKFPINRAGHNGTYSELSAKGLPGPKESYGYRLSALVEK